MKLIEALKIARESRADAAKKYSVSVVCGFNPLHLLTFLAAELRLRQPDLASEVHAGLYGDFWGNLERAREEDNDAVIVLLEWADLDPRLGIRSLGGWDPSGLSDLYRSAESRAVALEEMVRAVAHRVPVAICLPTLPLPPISFTPGWQASELELSLRLSQARLANRCAEIENVRVLSPQRIDQLSSMAGRFDVRSEVTTGFPYHLNHASIVAAQVARLLDDKPPKKGLITDLDGTLWSGIVGEVGVEGIAWDLDHHAHIHGLYQQFIHSLAQAGVLIGVASKNDSGLVREAFRRNDMLLPSDSIFPLEANWGPKSDSVDRILQQWNIGPESVVFLDDSPTELAEVQARQPAIECILFPSEQPDAVYTLLQDLRDLFGKPRLLEEDRLRMESIRLNERWLEENSSCPTSSPESFLRKAESEVSFSFAKEPLDPRAFELINKTNQFNLNGRRYNSSEWVDYIRNSNTFLLVVSYRDKYGSLGKIAILTGRRSGSMLVIDNWVMSCRAFGRRIEYKCLELLFDREDVGEVEFDFKLTERNGPMKTFLRGFLGADPAPHCVLPKRRFLKECPETFHAVAEVIHG